jgi:hypothetical protein
VAQGILIRVQQDARGVVVSYTSIRVQREDVWANDALNVEVSRPCSVSRSALSRDRQQVWLYTVGVHACEGVRSQISPEC